MKENKLNKLKSMSEANLDHNNEDWLEPSEKVWKNVKENLPKKRRRRNVLPFFFLLFGLSTAIIIFVLNGSNGQSHVSSKDGLTQSTAVTNENKASINENTDQAHYSIPKDTKENTVTAESSNKELVQNSSKHKISNIKYANASINKNKFQNGENIVGKENNILSNTIKIEGESNKLTTASEVERIDKNEGDQVILSANRIPVERLYPINSKVNYVLENKNDALFFYINGIEESKVEVKKSDFPVFFGLGFSSGMTSNKKNAKSDNLPLSELIKSSVYRNNYSLNLEYSKVINNKLSFSVLPSLSFDQLYTTYVLNIPYDYNTEIIVVDEKENTFSHSLPTDIGNIKTKLVVSRAANSPVAHNEIINFDFTSKHQIINFSLPIRFNYHFTNFEKGFYIFPYVSPEYELSQKLSAEYLKSNHTFVHTKSAEINQDFTVGKFHLGLGAGLGYRLRLMDKFILNINTNYTSFLNTHGRSNLLNAGTSLLYSF